MTTFKSSNRFQAKVTKKVEMIKYEILATDLHGNDMEFYRSLVTSWVSFLIFFMWMKSKLAIDWRKFRRKTKRLLILSIICEFSSLFFNFNYFNKQVCFRAELFDEPVELSEIKQLKIDSKIFELTDDDRLQMKDLKIK